MNIRWQPNPDAVERANAIEWGALTRKVFRPIDYGSAIHTALAAMVLYLFAAGGQALWKVFVEDAGWQLWGTTSASLALAALLGGSVALVGPELFMRLFPSTTFVALLVGAALISINIAYGGGPGLALAVFYISVSSFSFYLLRMKYAIAMTALTAVFVAWATSHTGLSSTVAAVVWVTIMQGMTVAGALIGMMGARLQSSVTSEQAARTSLATLAHDLEDQVQSQVEELERLGQLRRFLAPQIADAVLAGGKGSILEPHRRLISVFFVDLRGFTAYTGNAEPEDVVGLLDTYYETVGNILHKHRATIGGYAGDGVMAFFGDPVESDAPARDAMEAALEASEALDELAALWQDRDIPVNYGIGLATGFATLGEVGFDDRVDYTALGNVVNLAARLCDKAEPGQVLMDNATSREAEGIALLKPVEGLVLKGMAPNTKAWTIA